MYVAPTADQRKPSPQKCVDAEAERKRKQKTERQRRWRAKLKRAVDADADIAASTVTASTPTVCPTTKWAVRRGEFWGSSPTSQGDPLHGRAKPCVDAPRHQELHSLAIAILGKFHREYFELGIEIHEHAQIDLAYDFHPDPRATREALKAFRRRMISPAMRLLEDWRCIERTAEHVAPTFGVKGRVRDGKARCYRLTDYELSRVDGSRFRRASEAECRARGILFEIDRSLRKCRPDKRRELAEARARSIGSWLEKDVPVDVDRFLKICIARYGLDEVRLRQCIDYGREHPAGEKRETRDIETKQHGYGDDDHISRWADIGRNVQLAMEDADDFQEAA